MAQIGVMVTGAGVPTVIAAQSQCEGYLLIGDVGTVPPLQGLSVEVDGIPFIQINDADLIEAFAQWQQEGDLANANLGYMLKIATGKIKKNTTLRLVNNGVTTPNIYAFSDNEGGVPMQATTKTINANSYEVFDKFSALLVKGHANIASIEVVWGDGSKATVTVVELAALFNLMNNSETDGFLAGGVVLPIDNTGAGIRSLQINTNSGGTVTVLVVKLPQAAFETLKQLTQ